MACGRNVKVWSVRKRRGKRRATYVVRWIVDGEQHQQTFTTSKLADSFRSDLLKAAHAGETFSLDDGLPGPMKPAKRPITWLEHAIAFMKMKWPESAPKYRKSLAESLVPITLHLTTGGHDRPREVALRRALFQRAFNPSSPTSTESDEALQAAVQWLHAHARPISDLSEPGVLRGALEALSVTADGKRTSDATVTRRRSALNSCLEFAVELGHLPANPLESVRRKRLPPSPAVDRRRVANPTQARSLLSAVADDKPELEAFFATMYFAGLRPAEALNLRDRDFELPDEGWGRLLLSSSYQRVGSAWTNSQEGAEERQLKHRAVGDTRPVPVHRELSRTVRRHLANHTLGPDGRLFVARTGRAGAPLPAPYDRPVSMNTIYRAWKRARKAALSADEFESPLARRPYDLRHACISTWLNAGVPPAQVAEWAGHSIAVLLSVYAKCIDGQEDLVMNRIERQLDD